MVLFIMLITVILNFNCMVGCLKNTCNQKAVDSLKFKCCLSNYSCTKEKAIQMVFKKRKKKTILVNRCIAAK